ncbi:hypothetical protein ACET5Y_07955 [Aeromonas veronii]
MNVSKSVLHLAFLGAIIPALSSAQEANFMVNLSATVPAEFVLQSKDGNMIESREFQWNQSKAFDPILIDMELIGSTLNNNNIVFSVNSQTDLMLVSDDGSSIPLLIEVLRGDGTEVATIDTDSLRTQSISSTAIDFSDFKFSFYATGQFKRTGRYVGRVVINAFQDV